jgi:transposase
MKITTVGVDLAKSVFSVHGMDEHGRRALRKTVRRAKLLEVFAQLPSCAVEMEACSGAQHLGARSAQARSRAANHGCGVRRTVSARWQERHE